MISLSISISLSLQTVYIQYMRCTGMHVICLCHPCTLLNSSYTQQGEQASERADRTWTNGRTNQPTCTNERTNEPTWNETNQRICNTQAQHNTAQPYEATAVPFTHETEKFPSLRTPRLRLPSPPRRYAFRLPLTPTLVGRGEEKEVRATVRLCASTV